MKHRLYLSLAAMALAAVACNNGEDTAAKTTTDTVTVTKTDTVVKEAPKVDSAAIYAYYESLNAKSEASKPKHQTAKAKTKSNKNLEVESHEQIVTYDVATPPPAPAAAPAAAAAQPTKVVVVHDKEMYYYIPNEKASYPGGEAAFNKYLASHIEYPERAETYSVGGVVYASISLDELGKVEKVDFPGHHLGYGLEEEAARVLMASPRWNPAKVNGQAVKSKFTVPINFKVS